MLKKKKVFVYIKKSQANNTGYYKIKTNRFLKLRLDKFVSGDFILFLTFLKKYFSYNYIDVIHYVRSRYKLF